MSRLALESDGGRSTGRAAVLRLLDLLGSWPTHCNPIYHAGVILAKRSEADYGAMSWHDANVYAFEIREGEDGTGEITLHLDYILEWLPPVDGAYSFRIAPAVLTFNSVSGLRFELDYQSVSAGLTPFTIGQISREILDYSTGYRSYHWNISINWPEGYVTFDAPTFEQVFVGTALIKTGQCLTPDERARCRASCEETRVTIDGGAITDWDGRNANVFYEVGYAHALGKIVLLLTQRVEDIPFDLKHRPHTVYGGSIESLRAELTQKLAWAIGEEARRKKGHTNERFSLRLEGTALPSIETAEATTVITGRVQKAVFPLRLRIRNDAAETLPSITHLYLFTREDSPITPTETPPTNQIIRSMAMLPRGYGFEQASARVESFVAVDTDAADGLTYQFRLPANFPAIPPGAVEEIVLYMQLVNVVHRAVISSHCRLRLHSAQRYHDYGFELRVVLDPPVQNS